MCLTSINSELVKNTYTQNKIYLLLVSVFFGNVSSFPFWQIRLIGSFGFAKTPL